MRVRPRLMAAGVLRAVLSGQRACRGPSHITGRAAERESWDRDGDGDSAQRHLTLQTPAPAFYSSSLELLFRSVFVIESRNVDASGRDWFQTQAEDRRQCEVGMSKQEHLVSMFVLKNKSRCPAVDLCLTFSRSRD